MQAWGREGGRKLEGPTRGGKPGPWQPPVQRGVRGGTFGGLALPIEWPSPYLLPIDIYRQEQEVAGWGRCQISVDKTALQP